MRPTWILLFALALLAGCTETPAATDAPVPETAATPAPGGAKAFLELANGTALPAIGFDAGDYNSTVTFTGDFPNPNTCTVQDCPEQTLSFDLTPLVPAQAPVDLTVSFDGDPCIDARLHVEDGETVRDIGDQDSLDSDLALRLVRSPAGTVTLVLRNCSLLAGDLGATSNTVTAEVRTVVRSEVLPMFSPVSLTMAPGDRIQAMGNDLEDLVIVPPGLNPIHLLGDFDFTVAAGMPSGRYVVVALGQGEAMLHGTVGPMRALVVHIALGEPADVVSGQPLSFEVPTQGVPLYAGLVLRSKPLAEGIAVMSFMGDHEVTFALDGTEISRAGESGCAVSCGMAVLGSNSWSYNTGYLPETLKPGTLQVTLTNAAANSFQAHTYMGYVLA